ncbi:DNA-binding protein [Maricaulis sp. W15]|uniref:Zn-ribbon domain-containing OB-fold protein n=1 Tax=Maricaulis sp. W15 TaxID=1772333 RepID=UPI000948CADF|nr:OB-fold domain-containing protein [Maricaulis sp. W15]OLF70998.1 DNA-binding protein [Maricaulis sp. W15]
MSARKRPAPQPNPETQAFWDGLDEGVLRIKTCGNCHEGHYYPRHICPHCGSADTRWLDTGGTGEIYSLSVMRRGEGAPFAVAYVTLDEGPSVLTNLVADDLDALAIGQRVRLAPQPSDADDIGDGSALPVFAAIGD